MFPAAPRRPRSASGEAATSWRSSSRPEGNRVANATSLIVTSVKPAPANRSGRPSRSQNANGARMLAAASSPTISPSASAKRRTPGCQRRCTRRRLRSGHRERARGGPPRAPLPGPARTGAPAGSTTRRRSRHPPAATRRPRPVDPRPEPRRDLDHGRVQVHSGHGAGRPDQLPGLSADDPGTAHHIDDARAGADTDRFQQPLRARREQRRDQIGLVGLGSGPLQLEPGLALQRHPRLLPPWRS